MKVQVHKIMLTVVDFEGLGPDGVRVVLENARYPNHCISPSVLSIDSRSVEWSDDHPLNNASTSMAEVERLFGPTSEEQP